MDYDLVGLGTIMVKSDTLKLNNSVTAHKDGDRDSSSLGHALSSPAVADAQVETTRRFTIIAPRFWYQPFLVSL
jgi:hypothetical protein